MAFETLIEPAELALHVDDPDWVVFDCRFSLADPAVGERAYRAEHIPGARYAHLERDLSGPLGPQTGRHPLPEPDRLGGWLAGQGVGNRTQVVAYDDAGGAMAARLWWLLRWLGHGSVAVLNGGWGRWVGEGWHTTAHVPSLAPAALQVRLEQSRWLDAAAVRHALECGDGLLVDARAAPRFRGEEEPIDSVAGHVPGALNRPFQENLDEQGRFLPASVLRPQFEALLGAVPPEKVIHMCGSGVTACHNLVAMEHVGLTGSRLYPGSWSEWICDPDRPVEQG